MSLPPSPEEKSLRTTHWNKEEREKVRHMFESISLFSVVYSKRRLRKQKRKSHVFHRPERNAWVEDVGKSDSSDLKQLSSKNWMWGWGRGRMLTRGNWTPQYEGAAWSRSQGLQDEAAWAEPMRSSSNLHGGRPRVTTCSWMWPRPRRRLLTSVVPIKINNTLL